MEDSHGPKYVLIGHILSTKFIENTKINIGDLQI